MLGRIHRPFRSLATLALFALLSLMTFSGRAVAQEEFYYAGLSPEENMDVLAWSIHYWTRVDNGGGAPGAGFAFESPVMNSQLFNPLRCARPTLEALEQMQPTVCDRLNELPTGLDSTTVAARTALRDAMLFGELSSAGDGPGYWEHIRLILAAPPECEWLAWDENGNLISVDVPLAEVSTVAGDAALEMNLSPESEQILATLIAAGGNWRSQCTDIPMWRSLITGETSTAEQFRSKVNDYLAFHNEPDLTTQTIYANFGTFGELPVVAVRLPDCYILMDPTNGNLSGPFTSTSVLDARGLLSHHAEAYQARSAVRYVTQEGCPTTNVAAWKLTPPPGTWTPAAPVPTAPPGSPSTAPGHWQIWDCNANAGGGCTCTSTGNDQDTGTPPKTNQVRIVCTCSSPGGGACPAPTPASPATPVTTPPTLTPPATPATPAPGGYVGCSCVKQWLW